MDFDDFDFAAFEPAIVKTRYHQRRRRRGGRRGRRR